MVWIHPCMSHMTIGSSGAYGIVRCGIAVLSCSLPGQCWCEIWKASECWDSRVSTAVLRPLNLMMHFIYIYIYLIREDKCAAIIWHNLAFAGRLTYLSVGIMLAHKFSPSPFISAFSMTGTCSRFECWRFCCRIYQEQVAMFSFNAQRCFSFHFAMFFFWLARRANDTIPAHSPAAMSGGLLQAGLIAVSWGDGILALHRTVWWTNSQAIQSPSQSSSGRFSMLRFRWLLYQQQAQDQCGRTFRSWPCNWCFAQFGSSPWNAERYV